MDDDLEHHEEEDGFSREGPHLPGVGSAWGAALEETLGVGAQGWEKPSWAGHPFLCKTRGASEAYGSAASGGRRVAPCSVRSPWLWPTLGPPRPELPPWVAVAWSVLNFSWKLRERSNLPTAATLPSLASSFLVLSSNLSCETAAKFSRSGGAHCECVDGKLLHRKNHSIPCIRLNQYLLRASPGHASGNPEAKSCGIPEQIQCH